MADQSESSNKLYDNFVLYWCSYSIRSLHILYTRALAGVPKGPEIHLERRWIDLLRGEQSEEWYLDINPDGQVPCLTGSINGQKVVMANTLKITNFLASRYPSLIPDAHAQKIKKLLADLHSIHFFSVSFDKLPFVGTNNLAGVKKRLEDPTISDHYRKLLEHKAYIVDITEVQTLEPAAQRHAQTQTRNLLAEVEEILVSSQGPWLFGESPTALDAHIVLFIARLMDVDKSDYISPALREYGDRAMQKPEYLALMDGKHTMEVPP